MPTQAQGASHQVNKPFFTQNYYTKQPAHSSFFFGIIIKKHTIVKKSKEKFTIGHL
jgi:hypothetical protein